MFRYLNGISTSETWFPQKYIEHEIKKKVDKTREKLANDEMAYAIRQYIDSLKDDPSWVQRIQNDTSVSVLSISVLHCIYI